MNNGTRHNVKDSERSIYNRGYGDQDILPDPELIRKITGKREYWMRKQLENLTPGGRILDIGCGAGHTTVDLAKCGFSVVGIDLSEVRIEQARSTAAEAELDVEFLVGDAEYPPFEEGSFDGVYCNAILHHLPDVAGDLGRYANLLRPGGQIFALEPGLLNPFAFIRRQFFPTSVHTPDEHPFVPYKFAGLFEEYFEEVKVQHFDILNLSAPIAEKVLGSTVADIVLKMTSPLDRALCRVPGVRELSWYVGVWARKRDFE